MIVDVLPDSPRRDTASASRPSDLCHRVLSVQDWCVHALADPCAEPPGTEPTATRCAAWHLIACPVSVARRGEVCAGNGAGRFRWVGRALLIVATGRSVGLTYAVAGLLSGLALVVLATGAFGLGYHFGGRDA